MFSTLAEQREHASKSFKTSRRQEMLLQLSQFLIDDLLHHDFKHAATVLATLVHNIEELGVEMWKCGVEVLEREKVTRREVLPFLRRLFQQLRDNREEIFLEMLLVCLCEDSVQEAYSLCLSNIYQAPFYNNPMLRGYCGLLAFLIWLEQYKNVSAHDNDEADDFPASSSFALSGLQSSLGFDLNLVSSLGGSQVGEGASQTTVMGMSAEQVKSTALKSFQSLEDVPGSWDSFVLAHVRLAELAASEPGEVRRILEKYQETNPTSPNANYFLARHMLVLHEKEQCRKEEVRLALLPLVQVFPTCELLLDFPPYAESTQEAVVTLLAHLDYPECARNTEGWLKLHKHLTELGDAALDLPEWRDDRCFWWPRCYFTPSQPFCADEDVLQACQRCANLLLPPDPEGD